MPTLTPLERDESVPAEQDAGLPAGVRPWYRRPGSWWLLLACACVVFARASFGFTEIVPFSFRNDPELQFYLSKLTAEGKVPLIDFEHGWNAGGWYVGALLYKITGDRPALWYFIWTVGTGAVLAYTANALTGLRLGLKKGVIFGAMAMAVILSTPPHGKYAIPALWFAILVPVSQVSQRRAVLTRMALAFVTLWLHVELALFLCAAVSVFDLLASRGLAVRARVQRVAALAIGGFVGVMSEFAFFAVQGLGPGEVSRQVFFGQTEEFPGHQFGWDLFHPVYFLLLIYPTAILLPFVPAVWRRLSDPTRLACLITLCLATIPIRRVGLPHSSAVSTLLVFQYALAFTDLHGNVVLPRWGRPTLRQAGWALLGGGWMVGAVAAGFAGNSIRTALLMIAMSVVTLTVSRRYELLWASTAMAAVLLALPVVAVSVRDFDRIHNSRPLAEPQGMARLLAPHLAECGITDSAWIVPGPIDLYDNLHLNNPTDYYLFHYNFAGQVKRATGFMTSGKVKAIILPDGVLPKSGVALLPVLQAHYQLCAEVPYRGKPVPPMQIWRYIG